MREGAPGRGDGREGSLGKDGKESGRKEEEETPGGGKWPQ